MSVDSKNRRDGAPVVPNDLGPNDPRIAVPMDIEEIDLLMKLIDLDDDEAMTDAEEDALRGIRRKLAGRRTKLRRKLELITGSRPA